MGKNPKTSPLLSFTSNTHIQTHTHVHTPPELFVPPSPEASGTDPQHETPCYPVPPACLQMKQFCQLQRPSNPLTSCLLSPTMNRSIDNSPTCAKQANCQVGYLRKITSKNLCAYPHLPFWVTGPCRNETGEGRAAHLTVESELSAPRRAVLVSEYSTDTQTGCLGVKEMYEIHRGTRCSRMKGDHRGDQRQRLN